MPADGANEAQYGRWARQVGHVLVAVFLGLEPFIAFIGLWVVGCFSVLRCSQSYFVCLGNRKARGEEPVLFAGRFGW